MASPEEILAAYEALPEWPVPPAQEGVIAWFATVLPSGEQPDWKPIRRDPETPALPEEDR